MSLAEMSIAKDPATWERTLTEDPEVLNRLLADLWHAVHANRTATRRPSIEEVFSLVLPEYSTEPFAVALKAKLAERERSIRWLARELHVHQSYAHRWTTGERNIVNLHNPLGSMRQIEAIAQAVGVHPAYFSEWRRLWVLVTIDDALAAHPNLSIGVWRKFSEALAPRRGTKVRA